MIKKILKYLMFFFIILFSTTFILTIFDYFNIIAPNIISIIRFLIPIVSLIIVSFLLGKSSLKKGYIEGLKLGVSVIFIFTILILLLDKFEIKSLIYFLILLLSSSLSSMIGINKKAK